MMLTGDNGILQRAGEAKEKTAEATVKERIQIEVLGSYSTENIEIDKSKLKTNLGNIGATVTEAGNSLMVTLDEETYEVDNKGNVKEASEEYLERNGIEVGDYITYVPPTNNGELKSYNLTAGASGYTADKILTQQYNIWRVLNKNADGSLDIMPAFKDTDVTYTRIYFRDAKGWNNAPYFLDDMCNKLYADEENGITARSIDYEDITSRMIEGLEGTTSETSTGLKKISKYQSEQVATLSTRNYIDSINKSTNTVTYKTVTSYPKSYFEVKDNESNPYYNENTIDTDLSSNGRIATKPATLSVNFTDYSGTITSTDFFDSNVYSVIFETESTYWLASRSVQSSAGADFGLRSVVQSSLLFKPTFSSAAGPFDFSNSHISPIVTLGSNVQVTKCTGANSQDNRHIVVP